MINAVICTPFRDDGGRRAQLWRFVQYWIAEHYDLPVHTGDRPGPFNRAAARNAAARTAGEAWEVAVFHDSDTIAHPDAIAAAITTAYDTGALVVAGDAHMYCDEPSTERILASGQAGFARPVSFDDNGIYERPCSGIFAVSRDTFERVGGYVEALDGWGYEDLVFLQQCGIFAGGNTWVGGHITLHLWHEPSPATAATERNRTAWQTLAAHRRRRDPAGARAYLAGLGHEVP